MARTKKILLCTLIVVLIILVYEIYAFGQHNTEEEFPVEPITSEINNIEVEEVVEPVKTEEDLAREAEEARIQDIKNQLITENYSPDLKVAFLTFDDGPNTYSNEVLDILNQYGIKGTFFVNGKIGEYNESIYKRIVNEGHVLANHTFSHNYTYYKDPALFISDVERLHAYLTEVTGVEPQRVFRFPGGSNNTNQTNVDLLVSYGYNFFDWNSTAGDGENLKLDANQTWAKVISEIDGKRIALILTHAESPGSVGTRGALPGIIEEMTNRGYTFLTLDPAYHLDQFISPSI